MTYDDNISPRLKSVCICYHGTFEDSSQDSFRVFLVNKCARTKSKGFRIALDVLLVDEVGVLVDSEMTRCYL